PTPQTVAPTTIMPKIMPPRSFISPQSCSRAAWRAPHHACVASIRDPRFAHLIRADPALLGEKLGQVAHNLVAACCAHSRHVRIVSLDARDGGIGDHHPRGDAALNRRACAERR